MSPLQPEAQQPQHRQLPSPLRRPQAPPGRAGVAEGDFLKRPPRFPAHGWIELAELPAKSSFTESFLALVLHLIFKYLGQLMQATTMQTPHDQEGSPWSVPLPPVPRERRPGAILACTNPCSPASCERVSRIAALNRVCRELRGATGVYMGKLST